MTDKWFEMWYDDKQDIIAIMIKNMTSDLNHGYDYFGKSIREQREMIAKYKEEFDNQLMSFAQMDEKTRNRWCYYDMLKRGVITR